LTVPRPVYRYKWGAPGTEAAAYVRAAQ
jgi:hypothetical protein